MVDTGVQDRNSDVKTMRRGLPVFKPAVIVRPAIFIRANKTSKKCAPSEDSPEMEGKEEDWTFLRAGVHLGFSSLAAIPRLCFHHSHSSPAHASDRLVEIFRVPSKCNTLLHSS